MAIKSFFVKKCGVKNLKKVNIDYSLKIVFKSSKLACSNGNTHNVNTNEYIDL